MGKSFVYKKPAVESSIWEVEIDYVDECSKAPKSIDVKIQPIAKMKIELLMKRFPSREWLAYLVGEDITVKDIRIPEQTATSASVNNIDTSVVDGDVIGVIHSHHGMGNTFSKTDDDWINENNDISLCISKDSIKGHVRYKTPCGCIKKVEAKAVVDMGIDFDSKAFLEDVDKKVKSPVYVPAKFPSFVYDEFHGFYRNGFNGARVKVDDKDEEDDVDELDFNTDLNCLETELKRYEESGMFTEDDDGNYMVS